MKKFLLLMSVALLMVSCQEKKIDRFVREAKEYSIKKCPERQDDVTILDSLVFSKTDTCLTLYYSLLIDSLQEEKFYEVEDKIVNENLNTIRNSVSFIQYRDEGVNFRYVYTNSNTGKTLKTMIFTKQDYK